MSLSARLTTKIVTTLVAMVAAFLSGASLYQRWWDRNVFPELAKRYPHDGQIGLDAFGKSVGCGAVAALVVFLLGWIWVLNTSRTPNSST